MGVGLATSFYISKTFFADPKDVVPYITNLIPTKISEKLPEGSEPQFDLTAPEGFKIRVFADLSSIGAPRVLTFDPIGNLVVSIPSAGKVVALPDKDGDGTADEIIEVESDLNRPHGLAFHEGFIYIAETDKISKFGYGLENKPAVEPQKLFDLPGGGRHFSRTIKIYNGKLYTAIGSSCDVCVEEHPYRSTILVSDLDGKNLEVFAKGLRNTVFFDFDENGQMWGNDMGRDFLGDNLPPDELNIIEKGKNYGWPYCYGKNVHDTQFDDRVFRIPANMTVCGSLGKSPSAFDYPAHIAPLGITFINSSLFPKEDQGDILSAFHGSWNSSVPVGYKVVKLNRNGSEANNMQDFITGFISDGEVQGRPVDLIFDDKGILYISDDKANLIYILTK